MTIWILTTLKNLDYVHKGKQEFKEITFASLSKTVEKLGKKSLDELVNDVLDYFIIFYIRNLWKHHVIKLILLACLTQPSSEIKYNG